MLPDWSINLNVHSNTCNGTKRYIRMHSTKEGFVVETNETANEWRGFIHLVGQFPKQQP